MAINEAARPSAHSFQTAYVADVRTVVLDCPQQRRKVFGYDNEQRLAWRRIGGGTTQFASRIFVPEGRGPYDACAAEWSDGEVQDVPQCLITDHMDFAAAAAVPKAGAAAASGGGANRDNCKYLTLQMEPTVGSGYEVKTRFRL